MSVIQRIPGLAAAAGMPTIVIPPAPWSPADLPSLVGFWVPDTLELSVGNAVASLPSSAATPHTLTQPSASARPLYTLQNGEGALNFDGSDDGLLAPDGSLTNAAQSITFFCLVKAASIPTGTSYPAIMRASINANTTTTRMAVCLNNTAGSSKTWGLLAKVTDAGGSFPYMSAINADTNPHVLVGSFNFAAQNMRLWLDGTRIVNLNPSSAYTMPATDAAVTQIGASLPMVLGPHGLIKSTAEPADLDRQKTEGWLAHYWGIAANLPSDHPFKLAPPT